MAGEAQQIAAAGRSDPVRRMEVAARFCEDRPARASIRSYRSAELAFKHRQVSRRVLALMDLAQRGSPVSRRCL